MREPLWIREIEAIAIHHQQLTMFGGPGGIRDQGLLESALARPKNLWAYAEVQPSLARLAAAYAFGICCNHPFVDGNKRTSLVVSFTFLEVNGMDVNPTQEDAYLTILGVAAGEVSEEALTQWFERNTAPR